jgi:hypothetical protein
MDEKNPIPTRPLSYARREQIATSDTEFVGMIAGAALRHAMWRTTGRPDDTPRQKAFMYSVLGDIDSKIRAMVRMVLANLPDLEDHTTLDDAAITGQIEILWDTFVMAWPDLSE